MIRNSSPVPAIFFGGETSFNSVSDSLDASFSILLSWNAVYGRFVDFGRACCCLDQILSRSWAFVSGTTIFLFFESLTV